MIACQKCKNPHPPEDLGDGMCVSCYDRDAARHYFSPGAIAAKKFRDRVKYKKQVATMLPKPTKIKVERRK